MILVENVIYSWYIYKLIVRITTFQIKPVYDKTYYFSDITQRTKKNTWNFDWICILIAQTRFSYVQWFIDGFKVYTYTLKWLTSLWLTL